MTAPELLPCPNPWCSKSAPDTEKRARFGGYTVFCHTCHVDCGTHDEPSEAIAAWNRRATPEALDASREVQALIAAAETRVWNAAIETVDAALRQTGKHADPRLTAIDALKRRALKKGE